MMLSRSPIDRFAETRGGLPFRGPLSNVHVVVHDLSDLFALSCLPSARHADGLYDSYMRTDHILKEETDTNSPSGLPPMSKHTVSAHQHTQTFLHLEPAAHALHPGL